MVMSWSSHGQPTVERLGQIITISHEVFKCIEAGASTNTTRFADYSGERRTHWEEYLDDNCNALSGSFFFLHPTAKNVITFGHCAQNFRWKVGRCLRFWWSARAPPDTGCDFR